MKNDLTSRIAAVTLSVLFLSNDLAASTYALLNPPNTPADSVMPVSRSVIKRGNTPREYSGKTVNHSTTNASSVTAVPYADFKAGHVSAYLGGHRNDPLGKPYDDIFDVHIDQEVGDFSFAYLMYEVYGLSNGADLPKSINGSETYGQLSLQPEEHWSWVCMAVDPVYLRPGENRIQFALPNSTGIPVEVKNVKIRLSHEAIETATVQTGMLRTLARSEDFEVFTDGENDFLSIALSDVEAPSIPANLVNLTRNATAYRFSGSRDQAYSVAIGVKGSERSHLNQLGEVRIFYFDQASKSWKAVHTDKVNFETGQVEATVPGGTDYFAGLIKTPEMPEAGAFLPTAISDIEPANPATGMRLMQPPSVSKTGEAAIQYPLAVPQGRGGMTPSLALTYSSDAGTGWLGMGWNIGVQSISVDTRWGVPRFPLDIQDEVYLLNGKVLSSQGGVRGNRARVEGGQLLANPRLQGNVRFFQQTMSSYREIERIGSSTQGYYWVVTTANQMKYYYGTEDGASLHGSSVLTTGAGHIVRWFLTKVEDKWGNTIHYTYKKEVKSGPGVNPMQNGGTSMVLEKIEYTGFGASRGKYSVVFETSSNRQDATVSANMGLKWVDDKRLEKIRVYFDQTEVMRYQFKYGTGDFFKTLLESVSEYRSDEFFYKHEFEYHSGQLTYGQAQTLEVDHLSNKLLADIPQALKDLTPSLYSLIMPSPLKTTSTFGWGVGGSVGVGFDPLLIPSLDKKFTFSGHFGYSRTYSSDRLNLTDVNGDGLPDLVYDRNDGMKYYPISRNESGGLTVGYDRSIGESRLFDNKGRTFTYGFDYVLPADAFYYGMNWNNSSSTTSRYLTDYNADGIVDLVVEGGDDKYGIRFGKLNSLGNLSFSSTSEFTANPVIKGSPVSGLQVEETTKDFEVVRIWQAPVSGEIDITGTASIESGLTGTVRVAVQHNDDFIVNFTNITPSSSQQIGSMIYVEKGDKVLFRSHAGEDGQQDLLHWNPRVEYVNENFRDGNGTMYPNSTYQDGFLLSAKEPVQFVGSDEMGIIPNLSVSVGSEGFSDDVFFSISFKIVDPTTGQVFKENYQDVIPAGSSQLGGFFRNEYQSPLAHIGSPIPIYTNLTMNPDDEITMTFEVWSHSNIDWKKIDWRPEVVVVSDHCDNEAPTRIYPNVSYRTYNYTERIEQPLIVEELEPELQYEVIPDLNTSPAVLAGVFNGLNQVADFDAFMVVKSGEQLLAKKALRFHINPSNPTQNNIKWFELDARGEPTGSPLSISSFNSSCNSCNFNAASVEENEIYVEFHTDGKYSGKIAEYLAAYVGGIDLYDDHSGYIPISGSELRYNVFARAIDALQIYHLNWGQFGWSPDATQTNDPIMSGDLHLPAEQISTEEYDFSQDPPDQSFFDENETLLNPMEQNFFMMSPKRGELTEGIRGYIADYGDTVVSRLDRWTVFGSYIAAYARDGATAPGIFGETEIIDQPGVPVGSGIYSAYGAPLISSSNTAAATVSGGPVGVSSTVNLDNVFFSRSLSAFRDLNGDGYPDVLTYDDGSTEVQFTNPYGGHGSVTSSNLPEISRSTSDNVAELANGSFVNDDNRFLINKASLSGSAGYGEDVAHRELIDLNGDGLPDHLYLINGSAYLDLNLGYAFSSAIQLAYLDVSSNTNMNWSLGLSAVPFENIAKSGKSTAGASFQAGLSVNSVGDRSQSVYVDLNGDGLNDRIRIIEEPPGGPLFVEVYINKGTSFQLLSGTPFTTEINESQSVGISGNAAGTFSFPLWTIKMSIKGGGSANFAVNKLRTSFVDMNGDGAVDFVHANEFGNLEVYYSQIDKSNLLKKVTNPLKGSFTLDYELVGNQRGVYKPVVKTHKSDDQDERMVWDMPDGKWVMSELTVKDGLNPEIGSVDLDGHDQITRYFEYDGGIKNRREREFLGFTRIATRHERQSEDPDPQLDRYIVEVLDYARPLSHNPADIKAFQYQHQALRHKYSLLYTIEKVPVPEIPETFTYVYTVDLMGMDRYDYDFRVVNIDNTSAQFNKVEWDEVNDIWTLAHWESIGESKCVFPAVVSVESVSFPVVDDPLHKEKYNAQKFEIEYDEYFNVIRYIDDGGMTTGEIDSVLVDSMILSYFDYKLQINPCDSLPEATGFDGIFSIHVIPCTDTSYQPDTLWVPNLSTCTGVNPYSLSLCHGEPGVFPTVHKKLITRTIYIYQEVFDAVYTGKVIAEMSYFPPLDAADRTNALESHHIYVGSTTPQNIRRHTEVSSLHSGLAPDEITNYLTPTETAVTNIEYDALGMGNVVSITGPENHALDRATTTFEYDQTVFQFVEGITNTYNESVCNRYDYATGTLVKSTDVNGHATRYQYDEFYRLSKIWAPRELYDGASAATVAFEYYPQGIDSASTDENKHVPVALTLHNTGNETDEVHFTPQAGNCTTLTTLTGRPAISSAAVTATFVDGMDRPVQIQTLNAQSISNPDTESPIQWINDPILRVSGFTQYNKFGKPVGQRSDFVDANGSLGTFSLNASTLIAETEYDYAYRKNKISVLSPNVSSWSETDISYLWLNNIDGTYYFVQKSETDQAVKNWQYLDSKGRTIVSRQLQGSFVTTRFGYDQLGQLLDSKDPLGEITTYDYDHFGRVVTETHPDRGKTDIKYDMAGNVTQITTPATGQDVITMSYDFNRLVSKTMPAPSGSNDALYDIVYSYGSLGDGKNGAGRITEIVQGESFKTEQYSYNELGQLHKEFKEIDVPNVGIRSYNTGFVYDSFGRILQMDYPDGDTVRYFYTEQGELERITSLEPVLNELDSIVKQITYDGFGNMSYIHYGNGTETEYTYLPDVFQLSQATVYAKTPGGSVNVMMSDREYGYNTLGMVSDFTRTVDNSIAPGTGNTVHEFDYTYDNLNRLKTASLDIDGDQSSDYTLNMTYNSAGGILTKTSGIQSLDLEQGMDYDLKYKYQAGKPHQLDEITTVGGTPVQYLYNATGSVETINKKVGGNWEEDQAYFWNEDQWLMGVRNDNGVHHYVYDQDGDRILKSSVTIEEVEVDGENINMVANLAPYTLYVNPYYIVTSFINGDRFSKHYYMGTQRVASQMGIASEDPGGPGGSEKTSTDTTGDNSPVLGNLQRVLSRFGLEENADYTMKELHTVPRLEDYYPDIMEGGTNSSGMKMLSMCDPFVYCYRVLYWYHPDYLGNVELITDHDGEVYEFFMYSPWGENLYEWRNGASPTTFSSPYRFNGKELDPETGLHYYGARYYENRASVWLSVDPKAAKLPHLTPYNFVDNNPIFYVDPDGRFRIPAEFANKYPLITRYLKENVLSDVQKSSIIIAALQKYAPTSSNGNTYFSDERIVWMFSDGSGPMLLALPGAGTSIGARGQTRSNGDIILATEMLDMLEKAFSDPDLTSEEKQAVLLEVFMTIIHEPIHVGEWEVHNGPTGEYEKGNALETEVWGGGDTDLLRDGDVSNDNQFNFELFYLHIKVKSTYDNPQDAVDLLRLLKENGRENEIPTLPSGI